MTQSRARDPFDDLGRKIIDAAPVVLLLLGLDGTIVHINPYCERLTGYTLDELRGKDWFEALLPARDRPRIRELFGRSIAGAQVRGGINPIVTRGGEEREIEWTDQMIVDGDGLPTALLAIGHDVTERVQAERARAALERRQRAVFDATFAFAGVFDLDGNVLDISSAPLAAAGLDLGALIGRPFDPTPWLGHSPAELRKYHDAVARARRGETVHEDVRVQVGDLLIDFRGVLGPVIDPDGRVEAIFGAGIDITGRRKAEDRLRTSEQRLLEAQRMAQLGVWDVDLGTGMMWWSEEQYRINGIPVGTPLRHEMYFALIHPEDRATFDEAYEVAIATGCAECQYRIVRSDQSVRHIHGAAKTTYDDRGEAIRLAGVNRDITESVLAGKALGQSEQRAHALVEELREIDRRKNDFIAMLSHELRNPLSAIRSSLDVLGIVTKGSNELAQRAAAIIDRQISQLSRLVDDLLDVSRITEHKLQLQCASIELAELVRAVTEDQRPEFDLHGVRLELEVGAGPLVVNGDTARLTQAVGNLLQNAAKFTPPGGTTRVSVTRDEAARQAIVRVSDTGVGIDPAMIGRLFQPFVQADRTLDRSKGGLGLGLALVKGVVELHGGVVSVRSPVGEGGAEFAIRLPLAPAPAPRASTAPPPATHPAEGRRVLVVEDNPDAAASLRDLLELDRHTVAIAGDGISALGLVDEFEPDVVLCDIGLPGMSGYQLARALREEARARTPLLIAVSGYAGPQDVEQAREAGFDHHLAKPAKLAQLRSLISSAPHAPNRR